jgi:cytosine/adenosine deaminase-related metal-dependent hydrolase
MLVAADWVVPGSGFPIRNGAVRVRGSRIAAVGPLYDLRAEFPQDPIHDYPGCTIIPGLVNAHTHLALTCLKGLLPPQPFHEWIAAVPRAVAALDADDLTASAVHGAVLSVAAGVTVVGDIAYGPEAIGIAADTGLGGCFFWEVLGITPDELAERLYELEYPADPARACDGRFRCGISPHAPYTSGPGLLQATRKIAEAQEAAFAIHVAESDAEMDLMRFGEGPFVEVASRLAPDFQPPRVGTVTYLDRLGVLEGTVAVHCTKTLPLDLLLLAKKARGAVVCPRSNAYLQNGAPNIRGMLDAGVTVAIGTDSLASNEDLDLLAEARVARKIEPTLLAEDLLRMMTVSGAKILGLEEQFGTLVVGKQADLAIHRISSDDPLEAVIEGGSRSTIEAVMTGGVFRVLDGGLVFAVSPVERASRMARQKASVALGTGDQSYL